jgi:hypothetical protein
MTNFADPLGTDQYSRVMVSAFDEREIVSVPTAGQAFFGDPAAGNSQTVWSDGQGVVEIDIIRSAGETLAALINRGGSGINTSGQPTGVDEKSTNFARTFPLIYETAAITAKQINEMRLAGESPYSGASPESRMRKLAMNLHMEIMRRIVRTNEYLAWHSLINGTMPAIYGTTNTDLIYDFLRKSTHNYTVSVLWDNASAVILNDMDDAWDLGRQDAFVSFDGMVLGGEAANAFYNDSEIRVGGDNRRIDLVAYNDQISLPARFNKWVQAGMTWIGKARTPRGHEFYLFTYDDVYKAPVTGTITKYMPDKKVLYFYSGARFDRYFGPSDTMPIDPGRRQWMEWMFGMSPDAAQMPNIKGGQILDPRMFYHDGYPSPDGRSAIIRSQAAPIYATTQTDAIVVQTVLT